MRLKSALGISIIFVLFLSLLLVFGHFGEGEPKQSTGEKVDPDVEDVLARVDQAVLEYIETGKVPVVLPPRRQDKAEVSGEPELDVSSSGSGGGDAPSGQGEFLGQDVSAIRSMAEPLHGNSAYSVAYHPDYTVGYSVREEHPLWVAYTLTAQETKKRCKRSGRFKPDPSLRGMDVTTKDYSHSGYDRGHLAPAADMAFNRKAMRQSFYLSNICPQLPEFNKGVWASLEHQVRRYARYYDSVHLVTGPLYLPEQGRIGRRGQIPVPSHFFKVLLTPDYRYAVAFVLEHREDYGESRGGELRHHLRQRAISVDSLEVLSGLDFFPLLPDAVEVRVEAQQPNFRAWDIDR